MHTRATSWHGEGTDLAYTAVKINGSRPARAGLTYIVKPPASSRGRGVRVVQDPRALDPATLGDAILQRYITDPLLIDVGAP